MLYNHFLIKACSVLYFTFPFPSHIIRTTKKSRKGGQKTMEILVNSAVFVSVMASFLYLIDKDQK